MQPMMALWVLYCFILIASSIPSLIGLKLEPRAANQASKYEPSIRMNDVDVVKINSNAYEKNSSASEEQQAELDDGDDDADRISISEPYKSILQTTARFAVAQTSLTNYVTVDTFMDIVSDTTYALSKPSTLIVAFKATVVAIITMLASVFILPASLIQSMTTILKSSDRSMKFDKYLPSGLNEMGIIGLVNEKTDELLGRFRLNDSSCREQTVCQLGELIRCTFPKASKISIRFISKNFSRPKYRNNKHLNAFLSGFIDQNCASENDNLPNSCVSNLIKSFTFCPPQTTPSKPNCQ